MTQSLDELRYAFGRQTPKRTQKRQETNTTYTALLDLRERDPLKETDSWMKSMKKMKRRLVIYSVVIKLPPNNLEMTVLHTLLI
jgi:hypothetical protein